MGSFFFSNLTKTWAQKTNSETLSIHKSMMQDDPENSYKRNRVKLQNSKLKTVRRLMWFLSHSPSNTLRHLAKKCFHYLSGPRFPNAADAAQHKIRIGALEIFHMLHQVQDTCTVCQSDFLFLWEESLCGIHQLHSGNTLCVQRAECFIVKTRKKQLTNTLMKDTVVNHTTPF